MTAVTAGFGGAAPSQPPVSGGGGISAAEGGRGAVGSLGGRFQRRGRTASKKTHARKHSVAPAPARLSRGTTPEALRQPLPLDPSATRKPLFSSIHMNVHKQLQSAAGSAAGFGRAVDDPLDGPWMGRGCLGSHNVVPMPPAGQSLTRCVQYIPEPKPALPGGMAARSPLKMKATATVALFVSDIDYGGRVAAHPAPSETLV